MIYELRDYVATPGRAEKMHERFRDHTFRLFERHGLHLVGFWNDADDRHHITYLLRFSDEEAKASAWAGFREDPEWIEVKSASESDGPIVAEMTSRTLTNPAYWTRETIAATA